MPSVAASKASKSFIDFLTRMLKNECQNNLSELARKTKVHRNHLTRYMSGYSVPTLATLDIISSALRVEPFLLLMNPAEKERWETAQPTETQDLSAKLDQVLKNQNDFLATLNAAKAECSVTPRQQSEKRKKDDSGF